MTGPHRAVAETRLAVRRELAQIDFGGLVRLLVDADLKRLRATLVER